MRGLQRRRENQDVEEETAFVSMTDLTVSFLFIVILLLAYFSSKYNPQKSVSLPVYEQVVAEKDAAEKKIHELETEIARLKQPNPLERYIDQAMAERKHILEKLRDQLNIEFPDLKVTLSEQSDALHFQGDGLFASGSASLRPERVNIVQSIGIRLQQLLPCYTLGAQAAWRLDCNPDFAVIEAVQIEGHTDSDGDDQSNLVLSTNRADETFRVMVAREPLLTSHLSYQKQPVLSVAGYGKMRPIASNDGVAGKAANRRIDLRLIMYVPARSEEIEHLRASLVGTSHG